MQSNKMDLLLDTHAWIWLISGSKQISPSSIKFIERANKTQNIFISSISCWEIAMLENKKRIVLEKPCLLWIKDSLKLTGIELINIFPEIAVESCNLPDDFHGDPADRIIVATSRVKSLMLVTRDKNILSYGKNKHLTTYKI